MSLRKYSCRSCIVILTLTYFMEPILSQQRRLRGVFAPVLTPYDQDGNLTVSVIPRYARYLKNNGISGILIAGTAGGSSTVDLCEREQLVDAWMKAAKPLKLKVIVQIGALSINDIKRLARYSQKARVDAIMTLPELYYKPTTIDQLVDFLEEINEAVPDMPLLYYHMPKYTNVEVDMFEFYKTASRRISQFKGMKCDLATAMLIKSEVKNDQTVFIQSGLSVAPGVLLGFDSFIVTEANVFPKQIMKVYNSGMNEDVQETRKGQDRVQQLNLALRTYGNLGSSAQVVMKMVSGIDVGEVPLPRLPLTKKQKRDLRENLIRLGVKVVD